MPKQIDYTLTEEELKQIRQAMKHGTSRVSKRATIVYNLHLGHAPGLVAEIHAVSLASVYNYYQRFKGEMEAGLADKERPGRPRKATAAYIQLLEETLDIDPQEEGYAFTMWTQGRLRTYLAEQTGIELSTKAFQDLMHRLGYRYRRPKRDLGHKQDPELREQVKNALEELKKVPKLVSSSYSLWTKAPLD